MGEGGNLLEAAISKGGAVVTLGWRCPAEHAAQPVVIVVTNIAGQGCLSIGKAGKALGS